MESLPLLKGEPLNSVEQAQGGMATFLIIALLRITEFYYSFDLLQLIAISCRDASLRDLRANSADLARVGSNNDALNSMMKQDRESDTNQGIRKNNYANAAPRFQSGVLRTNCIDCLDRTNVAQYAYGLAALGRQLNAMGLTDQPKLDADSSIAAALMDMYQSMGDALAQQYGGSAAHNTVCLLYCH